MLQVKFNYNGQEIKIQCKATERLKEVFQKYNSKVNIDKVIYLYGGDKINEELKLEEIINQNDKNLNQIKIVVYDINKANNDNLIESKEIICPTCNENVLINLKDYQLEMKCKNNHINKISFKDFNKKIDSSKFFCNKCNKKRCDIYNNELYLCLQYNINLCPLCKSQHGQNHDIINYDKKNYICNKHNDNFTKYCCNKNIYIKCEKEHKSHNNIYYDGIFPDNIEKNDLKEYINSVNNEIKGIINKLNDLMKNMEKYYYIYNNVLELFKKNINYEILQNINEFLKFNNKLIKDIKQIIEENNINNKFKIIN